MASDVEICNRALQKLGAKRITSLDDDSVTARACSVAYDPIRLRRLRAHTWNCATKRAQLAESTDSPAFGPASQYALPSDYVRLLPPDPSLNLADLDWQIEAGYILTDDSAPLNIRYVYDLEDVSLMDSLLREAISTDLALELCEELTQSNTKKESLKADLKEILAEAKRTNAIENVSQMPPEDSFVTVRS